MRNGALARIGGGIVPEYCTMSEDVEKAGKCGKVRANSGGGRISREKCRNGAGGESQNGGSTNPACACLIAGRNLPPGDWVSFRASRGRAEVLGFGGMQGFGFRCAEITASRCAVIAMTGFWGLAVCGGFGFRWRIRLPLPADAI
jgi:hypothetical protein